ncbi:hypothetical protein AVEN_130454-1 [Araneus ventricosus]|uniref:Uncharacterized protein n=1 Tax=Araneus ventricosus TaxID=182803 RepID=A0A4Y2QZC3_ARAVE|nr:hypothetical protein AVEN_130454-1 [Araneus ventricosus]
MQQYQHSRYQRSIPAYAMPTTCSASIRYQCYDTNDTRSAYMMPTAANITCSTNAADAKAYDAKYTHDTNIQEMPTYAMLTYTMPTCLRCHTTRYQPRYQHTRAPTCKIPYMIQHTYSI